MFALVGGKDTYHFEYEGFQWVITVKHVQSCHPLTNMPFETDPVDLNFIIFSSLCIKREAEDSFNPTF
jgi:hypothetical protein